MREINGNHGGLAELKGASDDFRGQTKIIPPSLGMIESVAEGRMELFHRRSRRKDGHLPVLHLTEASHIIETHDMVSVGMSDECRIEALHSFAKALNPEFRGRINDEMKLWCLHKNRGAGALVTGVCGEADLAVTSDDRHPLRGSGS